MKILNRFSILSILLVLFSSSILYVSTTQFPQDSSEEIEIETFVTPIEFSENKEAIVTTESYEIDEIEEPQERIESSENIESKSPKIINENSTTQIFNNSSENPEKEIPKNQTEIPQDEEPVTSYESVEIFNSAELWYEQFKESYYNNNQIINSTEQTTLWGTNLGQPRDYTTYPFFSQPETRQLYIDANIKIIRIFNSDSLFSNAEYAVDEIISIGATPIIVTGTERLLEYVKKCGTKAIYQIGNEPNYHPERYGTGGPQGYADWYKYLVDQCVTIEPNAKFMTAGIGIWADLGNLKDYKHLGLDYITATINSGAKVDYVAFNYYTHNPEEILTQEEVLDRASRYKEIVQIISEATDKPVACTEWNFGQWTVPNHWDTDKEFIDKWTKKALNGLKDCVFSIQWFAQHWTLGDDSPMAMIDSYGNPKPLHFSFKNNTS